MAEELKKKNEEPEKEGAVTDEEVEDVAGGSTGKLTLRG